LALGLSKMTWEERVMTCMPHTIEATVACGRSPTRERRPWPIQPSRSFTKKKYSAAEMKALWMGQGVPFCTALRPAGNKSRKGGNGYGIGNDYGETRRRKRRRFEKLQLSQQNKNEQQYKNITHSPLSKGKKEPRLFTKVPPMSGPHKGVG
jgi:hypothetical protein